MVFGRSHIVSSARGERPEADGIPRRAVAPPSPDSSAQPRPKEKAKKKKAAKKGSSKAPVAAGMANNYGGLPDYYAKPLSEQIATDRQASARAAVGEAPQRGAGGGGKSKTSKKADGPKGPYAASSLWGDTAGPSSNGKGGGGGTLSTKKRPKSAKRLAKADKAEALPLHTAAALEAARSPNGTVASEFTGWGV